MCRFEIESGKCIVEAIATVLKNRKLISSV